MMPRDLVVRPDAEREANEAYDWYEEREPGLGGKFRNAIKRGIDSISTNPLRYPVVFGTRVRHAVIRDFPFRIIFSIEGESLVILAIFHDSRNPMMWHDR
jgi:toxin ParE1/3/4